MAANDKSLKQLKKLFNVSGDLQECKMWTKVQFASRSQQSTKQHLQSILGFSEGSLTLKYLGVLIVGRELHYVDCEELIGKLHPYIVKWWNRTISYDVRVQLSNWVLLGQLHYWFQAMLLPMERVKHAQQIIYNFIWNEGKGMAL